MPAQVAMLRRAIHCRVSVVVIRKIADILRSTHPSVYGADLPPAGGMRNTWPAVVTRCSAKARLTASFSDLRVCNSSWVRARFMERRCAFAAAIHAVKRLQFERFLRDLAHL